MLASVLAYVSSLVVITSLIVPVAPRRTTNFTHLHIPPLVDFDPRTVWNRLTEANVPVDEHLLENPRLRHGLRLTTAPPSAAAERVRVRLPDLQFKLDMLHANLNAARTCARVVRRTLDARFGLLGKQTLSGNGAADSVGAAFRALSRVDIERPPAKVQGDAARSAAREVQRATQAGAGWGERRLTLPTAIMATGQYCDRAQSEQEEEEEEEGEEQTSEPEVRGRGQRKKIVARRYLGPVWEEH
ncbi:hypothetical protein B0H14DRAFT_3519252 [Mycena olivaceomarginata]|nr:hypothetical protein B0H14DRAFT_3519252 [Mycena olivaceomarginata]